MVSKWWLRGSMDNSHDAIVYTHQRCSFAYLVQSWTDFDAAQETETFCDTFDCELLAKSFQCWNTLYSISNHSAHSMPHQTMLKFTAHFASDSKVDTSCCNSEEENQSNGDSHAFHVWFSWYKVVTCAFWCRTVPSRRNHDQRSSQLIRFC